MLEICICTHNPRLDVLALALESIANQDSPNGAFRVLLVDNASNPKLTEELLAPLVAVGIPATLLYEETPGIARARVRAIHASIADWILWIDDDNELTANYLRVGLEFISKNESVGCFGGKLLLARDLSPSQNTRPLLPYLGIKDEGEEILIGMSDEWEPWEPPTAGSWVNRKVFSVFAQKAESPDFFKLGRIGKTNLSSCEDSFMMRTAYHQGLSCAYVPELILFHHLSPHRFKCKYLLKLMHAYGTSHVILETFLHGYRHAPKWYSTRWRLINTIYRCFKKDRNKSTLYATAQAAYHIGCYSEHKRQKQYQKNII